MAVYERTMMPRLMMHCNEAMRKNCLNCKGSDFPSKLVMWENNVICCYFNKFSSRLRRCLVKFGFRCATQKNALKLLMIYQTWIKASLNNNACLMYQLVLKYLWCLFVAGIECWVCDNVYSEKECLSKGHMKTCPTSEVSGQHRVRRCEKGLTCRLPYISCALLAAAFNDQ